jgi:structure-specific recognition protein 1
VFSYFKILSSSGAMSHQKVLRYFFLQDKPSYADDFGDSDQEDEPDAYLARVKAEAEERDEGEGGESEEESTDEDFNPDQQESDVAEE